MFELPTVSGHGHDHHDEGGCGCGDKGGGAVPPHQTLIFDLTLVSATAPAAPQSGDPQVSLSAMNRQQGNVREQGAILTIPQ